MLVDVPHTQVIHTTQQVQRRQQRAATKYARADVRRELDEDAGVFTWPTPSAGAQSIRAEDVHFSTCSTFNALSLVNSESTFLL